MIDIQKAVYDFTEKHFGIPVSHSDIDEPLRELLQAAVAEQTAQLSVWKDALTDAAVESWTLADANVTDPRKILAALLAEAVQEALDPQISQAVAQLVAEARAQALNEAAQVAKKYHESIGRNTAAYPSWRIEQDIRALIDAPAIPATCPACGSDRIDAPTISRCLDCGQTFDAAGVVG